MHEPPAGLRASGDDLPLSAPQHPAHSSMQPFNIALKQIFSGTRARQVDRPVPRQDGVKPRLTAPDSTLHESLAPQIAAAPTDEVPMTNRQEVFALGRGQSCTQGRETEAKCRVGSWDLLTLCEEKKKIRKSKKKKKRHNLGMFTRLETT